MTKRRDFRTDFVMFPRAVWDEAFERYGVETAGLLAWLVLEAQYRPGREGEVYETVTSLAERLGRNKRTMMGQIKALGGDVEVLTDRSESGTSRLLVVRYRELAGQSVQRSVQRSVQKVQQPNASTSTNAETSEVQRNQDSFQSVPSGPSLPPSRKQARADANGNDYDQNTQAERRRLMAALQKLDAEEAAKDAED